MSKKIALVSVMVVAFVAILMAFAGTALANYNFTSHTVDHSAVSQTSSDAKHDQAAIGDNPCEACHTPHGATGAYLWEKTLTASDSIGGNTDEDSANAAHYSSDIKPLCYSCHDGSVTPLGSQTVFSTGHYNHRTTAASYVPTGSTTPTGPGKDCDRCHNPHDDNAYSSTPAGDGTGVVIAGTSKYLLPEYKTRTYDENGNVVKFSNDGGTYHLVTYAAPTVLSAEYNWTSATGSNPAPTGHKAPSTLSRWSTKISGGDFCATCHESNLPSQTTTSKRFVHPVYQPAGKLIWDSTTMGIGNIDTVGGLLIANTLGRSVLAASTNPGANTIASSWLKAGLFDPSASGNPRNGTRLFNSDGTVNGTASTANGGTRVATAYVMCESCHAPHGALDDGYTAPTAPATTGVHHLNTMAESALCGNCH